MKHKFEQHNPCSSEGHCRICDGGLAVCTVCWGAEGTLTLECPRVKVPMPMQDLVYAGKLDYENGTWFEPRAQFVGRRRLEG